MVDAELYGVGVTLGVIIIIEIVHMAKSTEMNSIDRDTILLLPDGIETFTFENWVFDKFSGVRSGAYNISRVQLLNMMAEYAIIFVVFVSIAVFGSDFFGPIQGRPAALLATATVLFLTIIWLFLPVITVDIYGEIVSEGVFPSSLIIHVFGVSIDWVLIMISATLLYPEENFTILNWTLSFPSWLTPLFLISILLVFILKSILYVNRLVDESQIANYSSNSPGNHHLDDF